jgi:hypothetical protein
MNSFCPYCLKSSESSQLHEACTISFYGDPTQRELPFSKDQLLKLAGRSESIQIGERIDYLRPDKLFLSPKAETHPYNLNTNLSLDEALRFQLGYLITKELQLKVNPSSLLQLKSGEYGFLQKRDAYHQKQQSSGEESLDAFINLEKDIIRNCQYYGEELLRLFEYAIVCFLNGSGSFSYNSFRLETSPSGFSRISPISHIHLAFKEWKEFSRERLFDLAAFYKLPAQALENSIQNMISSEGRIINILIQSPLPSEAQMVQIELLKSRISRLKI